jgi:hypothetical protein
VESLPSKKRDHRKKEKNRKEIKKRGEQGLKRKGGETSVEKLRVLKKKKKRMRSISCWERFY